jgi:hypothetical protein
MAWKDDQDIQIQLEFYTHGSFLYTVIDVNGDGTSESLQTPKITKAVLRRFRWTGVFQNEIIFIDLGGVLVLPFQLPTMISSSAFPPQQKQSRWQWFK